MLSIMAKTKRQDWEVSALHNREDGSDKFYVVRIDNVGGKKPYMVAGAWGAVSKESAQGTKSYGTFATLEEAAIAVNKLRQEKINKGYQDIENIMYRGKLTLKEAMDKIDTTRIVGYHEATKAKPPEEIKEPTSILEKKFKHLDI